MASLLRPVAPSIPDFHVCNPAYGRHLVSSDCIQAINGLPGGSVEVEFTTDHAGHPVNLPISSSHGNCIITVEMGGPILPRTVRVVPNKFREMASYIIEQCILLRGEIGGFVTSGISNMLNYVVEHNLFPEQVDLTLPPSTAYLTVTVSGSGSPKSALRSPGDTDPAVPLLFSSYMGGLQGLTSTDTGMRKVSSVGAKMWDLRSAGMTRSSSNVWWLGVPATSKINEMVYECDAGLGKPSEVDCLQVEWSQLHPGSAASDTVRVGPGAVQLLHSNTCSLAISASVGIVLTWAQVQAAVSALMDRCIQNPVTRPQGGRAYYRLPERVQRKMKNRQNRHLTGLNALPPHANITVFQQQEPWTNLDTELKSCTVEAVLHGNPISKCKKA